MTSITTALGAGSGVDTAALVKGLVEAQFAARNASITKRDETLTAQISAVSELRSGISGFSNALTQLARGGSLASQATSSDTALVRATTLPGARVSGTQATVEVRSLAAAQVAVLNDPVPANTRIGAGTITIGFGRLDENGLFVGDGKALPPIEIGAQDARSLGAVAARINAAAQGVSASVVSDTDGERLVLKGPSGAARAFELAVTENPDDPGLSRVAVAHASGGTTRVATAAADARFTVDGVEFSRSTNSVTGVVPGVRLDLQAALPGRTIAIGAESPGAAITQAVNDVVATFNEFLVTLRKAVDPLTGPLARDPAAGDLLRRLGQLTLTPLTTGGAAGAPATLADIGIATNRDGSLRVDTARLSRELAEHPQTLEAMFADATGASGRGLPGALNAISISATGTTAGLGASATRYTAAQTVLSAEKEKVAAQAVAATGRMTQQFATSEARVAAYKATQSFMENQIKAWNRDG